MTSNSRQRSAARGLVPLSILTALLAIILAAYLNLSPQPMASESTTSLGEAEAATDASTDEVLASTLPEDSEDEKADEGSADSEAETEAPDADADGPEDADAEEDASQDAGDENTGGEDADASEDAGVENTGDEENPEESDADTEEPQPDSDDNDAESGDAESGDAESGEAANETGGAADSEADSESEDNAAEIDTSDTPAAAPAGPPSNREANVVVGTYQGMPVGYTEDGLVFRGEPDAPVTIFEYSDYQCPFCQRHFAQTETPLNEAYVVTGKAKVVFVDFPLVQLHPNAPVASAAALCVAEQDPVAFWEMHSLIFETQNQWSNSPDPLAFFRDLGAPLEIDQDAFAGCLDSGRADAIIERTYAQGRAHGFSGTPSFQFVMAGSDETYDLVGAQPYDRFSSWIDSMAVGEIPADAVADPGQGGGNGARGAQGDPELPYWATDEGLAADPEREGFTMAGDAYRGSLDAPIVVIEYSDYQCPFCRRHTEDTQPLLDEQFVETGQVRWVFRHFPLNIHQQAPAAGVAAECAGEQGQFWDMHEILFGDVAAWSVSDPNPRFTELAEQIGLDLELFATCLVDESMLERINSDFADGRQFVQGTPTFIVMNQGQGRLIPGALPADSFVQAIQQVIDSAQ